MATIKGKEIKVMLELLGVALSQDPCDISVNDDGTVTVWYDGDENVDSTIFWVERDDSDPSIGWIMFHDIERDGCVRTGAGTLCMLQTSIRDLVV